MKILTHLLVYPTKLATSFLACYRKTGLAVSASGKSYHILGSEPALLITWTCYLVLDLLYLQVLLKRSSL